jgi:hypothetical protein
MTQLKDIQMSNVNSFVILDGATEEGRKFGFHAVRTEDVARVSSGTLAVPAQRVEIKSTMKYSVVHFTDANRSPILVYGSVAQVLRELGFA